MSSLANNRNGGMLITRNERSMPKWVTEQSDRIGPRPPPPPLTPENGHAAPKPQPSLPPKTNKQPEPDYEVIEFSNQQYSNAPLRPNSASSGSKTPDNKLKCTLCGSGNPWVTCEECSQQIFCASCDDMFHKHPKRKDHLRKTLEKSRPPLPPKVLPGEAGPSPPVAPPRRNKRGMMTPLMQRKDQASPLPVPPSPTPSMKHPSWQERFGSLPRGLNLLNRPLPETPKTPSESSRSTTPKSAFDNIQRPPSVTLEKIKSKANATLDRMQLLQQRYRQQKEQMERERSSGSVTEQRQLALQHHQMAAQRANQLGHRAMSSSVFNLNHINRKQPVNNNSWMGNSMQQAQSMAQLNCANCGQHQSPWNNNQQQHIHMPQDPWSNQLSAQQHLNRSNMSLNVPAGYMMQPQMNGMYPPPTFMNQRGLMQQMYPQQYMGGMPVMNPGLMGMPPSTSRAASRAGSRMASPAMSRKSVTLRRKQRSDYVDDQATDDEDSDEDDRRSITSNRSGVSRSRQRRLSSASQMQLEDEMDLNQNKYHRNRTRVRRDSVAKSVHNDWAPGRRNSSSNHNNNNRSADSGFNSPLKPSRIYSDLDSEGSGTRALVQAKIEQKLKEDNLKESKQTKSKRQSPTPQKTSAGVQTSNVKQLQQQEEKEKAKEELKKTQKQLTESEAETQTEEEEEEKPNKIKQDTKEKLEVEVEVKPENATEGEESEEEEEEESSEAEEEPEQMQENEIEEDDLGPPPSTPDHEWECEFCTFVNEPNIKICSICCKTPSIKPKKAAKAISPPKQIKTNTIKKLPAKEKISEATKQKDKTGTIKKKPQTTTEASQSSSSSNQPTVTNNTDSEKVHTNQLPITNTNSAHKKDKDGNEALANAPIKKESVEDIWAALDDNIQATAHEVIRKAETKLNNKVSTACGTSSKSSSVEREVINKRQSQAKEIETSPPPQSISTQTYDTLPAPKSATREEPKENITNDSPFFNDMIQESDLYKHTAEELNAALKYCGPDMHPLVWLRDHWPKLIQTVQSLATKYGQERAENTIGTISQMEAREALRMHIGNIWQAVSECIEQRQRKYRDISSKGNFSREDIVTALTTHQGNVELALTDLGRTQLKPFLMRIWGSPGGVENESGSQLPTLSAQTTNVNIDKDIHNFLSANASECMQTPNTTGAYFNNNNNNQLPSPYDRPASFQSSYENNNHMLDNASSYSADSNKDFALNSPLPLDDSILSNKYVLKDLETLIGNMENNQQNHNEQVLRSIHDMLTNSNNKIDNEYDSETMRILTKSPITSPKLKPFPKDVSNTENEADVKNFVWQHIQEIVPNLVQQVEMELMEDIEEKLKNNLEKKEIEAEKEITPDPVATQVLPAPPPPPPIDQDEFLMEEVIKPNIKNASIREEVPPQYVYTAEIATFQLTFDKGLEREHEDEFEFESLEEAVIRVYKMFEAPKTVEIQENTEEFKEPVELQESPKISESLEMREETEEITAIVHGEKTKEEPQVQSKTLMTNTEVSLATSTNSSKIKQLLQDNMDINLIGKPTTIISDAQYIQSTSNNGNLGTLVTGIEEETGEHQANISEIPTVVNNVLPSINSKELHQENEIQNFKANVTLEESSVPTLLINMQNDGISSTFEANNHTAATSNEISNPEETQILIEETDLKPTPVAITTKEFNNELIQSNDLVPLIPSPTDFETLPRKTTPAEIIEFPQSTQESPKLATEIIESPMPIEDVTKLPKATEKQELPTSSNKKRKPNKESKIQAKNMNLYKRTTIKDLSKDLPQAEAELTINKNIKKESKTNNSSTSPASNISQNSKIINQSTHQSQEEIFENQDVKSIENHILIFKETDENINDKEPTQAELEQVVTTQDASTSSGTKQPDQEGTDNEATSKEADGNINENLLTQSESKQIVIIKEVHTFNNTKESDDNNTVDLNQPIENSSIPSSNLNESNKPIATNENKISINETTTTSGNKRISKIPVRRTASNKSLILTSNKPSQNETKIQKAPEHNATNPQNLTEISSTLPQIQNTINLPTDNVLQDESDEEELYSIKSDSSTTEVASRADQLQSPTSTSEMFLVIQQAGTETNSTIAPSTSSSTLHSIVSQSSGLKSPTEFIPSGDPSKQNLTELVEDTQRLIKQMKDEISIDDFESSTDEGDYTDDYSDEYDDEEEEEEEEEGEEEEEDEDDWIEEEDEDVTDEEYDDITEDITEEHEIYSEETDPVSKTQSPIPNPESQDQRELNNSSVLSNITTASDHSQTLLADHLEQEEPTITENITHNPVSSTAYSETENSLPELPVEAIINENLDNLSKDYVESESGSAELAVETVLLHNNTLLQNESQVHLQTTPDSEDKTAIVSGLKDILSVSISVDNELETENSLPELPVEVVADEQIQNLVTNLTEDQTALVNDLQDILAASIPIDNKFETENSLPELPVEVVVGEEAKQLNTTQTEISSNKEESQDLPMNLSASFNEKELSTTSNETSNVTSKETENYESTISNNATGNTFNASNLTLNVMPSISPSQEISPVISHKPSDQAINNQRKNSVTNDDNLPSTSKGIKSAETKKKSITTEAKKTLTASKIPKPKEAPKDPKNTKAKETASTKPQNEFKKKLYTRSKSFSGPPTPIGISSVKSISQKFISPSTQPTAPKKQPTVTRKSSIVEAINKLTKPSATSTEKPSISNLFKSRTQPRIPKKKYHETCFSDDDYESTTSEEEPEPLEVRQRKFSVPVFRAYPSVQEPEEVKTEELVEKFMKEELTNTIAEAQIAATLISMKFQQDVSLWAAKECSDLDHAITLLKQECELCSGTYALNEIVSMLKCTHKCCKQCAKTYFTVQITERSINDCSCPFCKLPELHNPTEHEDDSLEYFSNLDIFLKNILATEVHELFQRKLRDRTLLKDPNFKWCVQCSSGFFARPKQKRLICPDCGSVTCAQCRKPWQKQHEGISCEQYSEWESANDPEVQAKYVQQHLEQNGIDCPKCKFRYSLTRGGCMHFTCTQCKYDFCHGCNKPFKQADKCFISPYCAGLGLHAHHPRNCLFYLRDKLPVQLQILLKNHGVTFEVDPIDDNESSTSTQTKAFCPIPVQKETRTGMVDTKCNDEVPPKHAGMCRIHYVEYLTAKVAKAKIDPLPIFDLTDCVQELRRRGIPLPERGPWDNDEIYKNMCAEVIRKKIPLQIA